MKVFIACDHNGVLITNYLLKSLKNTYDIEKIDLPNDPLDDYPIFAFALGEKVNNNEGSMGILICGTGIGISIAANKVKNIRCAHVTNINDTILSRQHNDANVLAIGSNYTNNEALKLVKTFLETSCLNEERHVRRIRQIRDYEAKNVY